MKVKKSQRPKGQRQIHINIPLSAYDILEKYRLQNGCQQCMALTLAVERYSGLADSIPPASRTKYGPGSSTESVNVIVRLPMELQQWVDKTANQHDTSVNRVFETAIEQGLTC